MISVENFYWILYEQLLRPAGMHANFFYPFGSTDLANVTFQELNRLSKRDSDPGTLSSAPPKAVFFYDQEPLYYKKADPVMGPSLSFRWFNALRILANSEHSQEKQQLIKGHSASDWYYFYHGFAALDWFRDVKYTKDNYNITHAFQSLNHLITGDRSYRIAMTARLAELDLLKLGKVSFHSTPENYQSELTDPASNLSTLDKILAKKHSTILSNGLYVDSTSADGAFSAHFGHFEFKLLQSCFLHVVNETVFYHNKLHLTEKIFKPIVARRPFVLVAAPGNLEYIRGYGFRTFSNWIDESYDLETNNNRRLGMIAQQVHRIANLSIDQRNKMHQEMQEVLQYNFNHFFGDFRRIIVEELLLNFEKCIRMHNNGIVDEDRAVRPDINYSQVRDLLLS